MVILGKKIYLSKKNKPHKNEEGKVVLTLKEHNIDTVIDIGANIGQTGERLRRWGFEGDIYSVEPISSLQEPLLEASKNDPKWTILPPMVIGDSNKDIEFNVSDSKEMSSVLEPCDELIQALPKTTIIATETIPMKTLDTLYEELNLEGKRVFVKMDTQGYEMNILKGGQESLKKATGLRLEMSLFEIYKGETTMTDIMIYLQNKGYVPHLLWEVYFSRKLNRQLQVDGVFYKDKKPAND